MSDLKESVFKTISKYRSRSKYEFRGRTDAFDVQKRFLQAHLKKLEDMKTKLESVKK